MRKALGMRVGGGAAALLRRGPGRKVVPRAGSGGIQSLQLRSIHFHGHALHNHVHPSGQRAGCSSCAPPRPPSRPARRSGSAPAAPWSAKGAARRGAEEGRRAARRSPPPAAKPACPPCRPQSSELPAPPEPAPAPAARCGQRCSRERAADPASPSSRRAICAAHGKGADSAQSPSGSGTGSRASHGGEWCRRRTSRGESCFSGGLSGQARRLEARFFRVCKSRQRFPLAY